jgi:hypothetical protein
MEERVLLARAAKVLLLNFLGLASLTTPIRASDHGILVHNSWIAREADRLPDSRIYRRYGLFPDGRVPNVVSFHCPADLSAYPRLSFEMIRVHDMTADLTSASERFVGRFLVNTKQAINLPGELIDTRLVFERTPETAQEFDAVLAASRLTLTFGRHDTKITYFSHPDAATIVPKLVAKQTPSNGGFEQFENEAMLQDCRAYQAQAQ